MSRPMPMPVSIRTDEEDFGATAGAMRSAGMLAVLPYDIEAQDRLAVPPVGAEDAEWFAAPVWLVVRKDLLEYLEE